MMRIQVYLASAALVCGLLPFTASADVSVSDGSFRYKAEQDMRYAYVGSEVEIGLVAGSELVISSDDHLVIRGESEKISVIPLVTDGAVDVLRSARKLMGFWMPQSVRRHAVLVLQQYSQEQPLDSVCRVLVIAERLSAADRANLNQLAADRGITIREGLQELELSCKS